MRISTQIGLAAARGAGTLVAPTRVRCKSYSGLVDGDVSPKDLRLIRRRSLFILGSWLRGRTSLKRPLFCINGPATRRSWEMGGCFSVLQTLDH